MDIAEYQFRLVLSVEGTAHWRAEKAVEHPEDTRNSNSSRSLNRLAARLEGLPPEHPKLRELWGLEFGPESLDVRDKAIELTETRSELLRQYGFAALAEGDPDQFLADLIAAFRYEMF